MKNRWIIIVLSAIVFSSCSSYKYGQNAEPTQKSNLTFGVIAVHLKQTE